MNIRFADTADGDIQDRACSILVSLSMVVDAAKRKGTGNVCTSLVYHHEMQHHYQRAVFDTLRLLQVYAHGDGFATAENVEHICQMGHSALEDMINANIDQFDTEAEEQHNGT